MAREANRNNATPRLVIAGSLILCFCTAVAAQKMTQATAEIRHLTNDFDVTQLDHPEWKRADGIQVSKYWNGETAPVGRRANVRMLWSATSLYVRFEANQGEPLIVSEKPQIAKKTMGLWNRDVVEIFLAPDTKQPRKYFEFEVAPTGEWIDLAIDYTGTERRTDWDFRSGMTSAAKAEKEKVVLTMKIPWTTFGVTPKAGDVWLGNLFRCVGKDPTRGYLTWQPTMTEQPNFHVPDKFGKFEFKK